MISKKSRKNKLEKNIESKKTFRIRNKKLFLTYSDIEWTKSEEDLRNHCLINFESIFSTSRDDFLYTIVIEAHESGNLHIHAFLEFTITQNIYSLSKLEIDFLDNKKPKHPNISPGKNKKNRISYMLKDIQCSDDVLSNDNLQLVNNIHYKSEKEYLANILPEIGLEKTIDLLHNQYKKLCVTQGVQLEMQLKNM